MNFSQVQPSELQASMSERWTEQINEEQAVSGDHPSTNDLHANNVVTQLIEKHTIEVISLKNKLQNEESNQIKRVLAEFEDKKTQAVDNEKEALSTLLTEVDVEEKLEILTKSAVRLQGKVASIEEQKRKAVQSVIEKLVEERFTAKEELMK